MDSRRADNNAIAEPIGPTAADARSPVLSEIGRIVRQARAKRGMTRKDLARRSGASERYLALIESGEGNPTVLVLDAIAKGLGLGLLDVLPLGADEALQVKAAERLRRLSVTQVEALFRHLDANGAQVDASQRGRRISLIGLRGAGKSSLGSALAGRLRVPFVELDKMVEREHGAQTAMLFEVYGQAAFRRYERESLDKVIAGHDNAVIATAGGIVADEATLARLLATTHVVWLRASPKEHMRRVMEQGDLRPMARNRDAMKDLVAILSAREPEYGRAHAQLDTSGKTLDEALDELTGIVQGLFARN